MQHILDTGNKIHVDRPTPRVSSSFFNMSHDVKLSCNLGYLIPIFSEETMPGDRWNINTEALVRLQPLVAPVLHRATVRTEWFFVPYRLVYPNWETFISPVQEGATAPVAPTQNVTAVTNSLADYLGLPVIDTPTTFNGVSAFPPACYHRLYWDWYADEDIMGLTNIFPGMLSDGDNSSNPYVTNILHARNWDKDYFTSCKPWPQKAPTVIIPAFNGTNVSVSATSTAQFKNIGGSTITTGQTIATAGSVLAGADFTPQASSQNIGIDVGSAGLNITGANLIAASGTMEQLRKAMALQKFFESDSRGGTRYIETIYQHFDENNSDYRLQRSEYIGSTSQPLVISEVLNMTGGVTGVPQGQMAGHGIAVAKHADGMNYHCKEHGMLMGIMSVMPTTSYFQGIDRKWFRPTRLDYPWPEFANLGEQAVTNGEIYWTGTGVDANTFGYIQRYAEWKARMNRVCGDFRTSLNFWHWGRYFSVAPNLNSAFITATDQTTLDRPFAVTSASVTHLLCHWFHNVKLRRKLPRFSVPKF
nr:MAG: major capsid protein [Microviridae sp.]